MIDFLRKKSLHLLLDCIQEVTLPSIIYDICRALSADILELVD